MVLTVFIIHVKEGNWKISEVSQIEILLSASELLINDLIMV
jgi:hypothetical protein